jgi:Ca2+-binding RTX toxin-like protein
MPQKITQWDQPVNVFTHDPAINANPVEIAITEWKDGGFAVVSADGESPNLLVLRRYDAFGFAIDSAPIAVVPIPPLAPVGAQLWDVAVTANTGTGELVVAWSYGTLAGADVFYTIIDPSGAISAPPAVLSNGPGYQADVSLSVTGLGEYVAVWSDFGQNSGDIISRKIGSLGNLSAQVTISTPVAGIQKAPEIAALAGVGNVYVWQQDANVYFQTEVFGLLSPVTKANTLTAAGSPDVAGLSDGRFAIAWTNLSGDAYVRIFNANGTPASSEILVNLADYTQDVHITALNDGGFIVNWHNDITGLENDAIGAQAYSSTGQPVGGPYVAFQTSLDEDIITLSDGRSVVVSLTDAAARDIKAYIIDTREFAPQATPGNDWLAGLDTSDTIDGLGGDDRIAGVGGPDFLAGGEGNDTLIGGSGADTLDGGTGNDTASYVNATATVQVVMYNTAYNTGDALGDVFTSIEALQGSANIDILVGGFLGDSIFGGAGGDWLDGTYGGDSLYGQAGNDHLVSRVQADILDGGVDYDLARYDFADAGLRAYIYDTTQNTGWAAGDTFVSIEGLTGSYFADDLRGDDNYNIIYGLGGADFIIGLGNSDLLIGGDGQDLFHFVGITDGGFYGDTIQDFVSGYDRISVTGQFFGLGSPGGVAIESWRFVAGTVANLATSQFIYDNTTQELFYDIDGTGAGVQVLLATLQSGATLAAGDILVI